MIKHRISIESKQSFTLEQVIEFCKYALSHGAPKNSFITIQNYSQVNSIEVKIDSEIKPPLTIKTSTELISDLDKILSDTPAMPEA